MSTTQQKVMSSASPVALPPAEIDAATQTDLPREYVDFQVSSLQGKTGISTGV